MSPLYYLKVEGVCSEAVTNKGNFQSVENGVQAIES